MKYTLMVFLFILPLSANAIEYEIIGNGFTAFYKQENPFDSTKKDYVFFTKRNFVFKCDQISFGKKDSYYFDSFSLNAKVALKIDNNEAVKKNGKYSTYQFSSDMVNDDRMYSTTITKEIIDQMKAGYNLNASGKFSGWDSYKVSLKGFTKAYNIVCK